MTMPDDDTAAALRRFVADGSDLDRPMPIDFFVAVPNEAASRAVAERVAPLGFRVSVEQDHETKAWTCYCAITIVPQYAAVLKIENQLDAIARAVGGHADGFGSFGNADPSKVKDPA